MTTVPWVRYADFLQDQFGRPVRKVCVDAGLTCPNRDGHVGTDGCAYCAPRTFTPGSATPTDSITEQLQHGIGRLSRRYPDAGWIAYFQPHSNTYAPAERLRELYTEALAVDGVVGLAIGTRPDCLPSETLGLLRELADQTYLQLELGLQSASDKTLRRINRGHSVADFRMAAAACAGTGIVLAAHMIAGLPEETRKDAVRTAEEIADCGARILKIHNFHVVRGSTFGREYAERPVSVPTLKEYALAVCDCLERLPRHLVIERLWASVMETDLIAPDWSLDTNRIRDAIVCEMNARGSAQGCRAD